MSDPSAADPPSGGSEAETARDPGAPGPDREPDAGARAPERARRWRSVVRACAWPLAVAACSVLPLVPGVLRGRTLAWRDAAITYEPVRHLVVAALRELRLPLWNPYEGTGQTLFAQLMHGVLHPVSVASAFLGVGVDGWLLAYVAFGAAGAWAAGRSLELSRPAAAASALAYAMSGYVLGMLGNPLYLASAASAPWVVAGMRSAARGRGVAGASVAVACAVFAGDPQGVATALVAGAVLSAGAAGVRGALRALLGAAIGVALAGVQLLPAFELLGRTSRGAGIVFASASEWWLDPARLVELVAPGFFWRADTWNAPVFAALGSPSQRGIPWSPSIYVGAAVLLLAAAGVARRRDGRLLAALSALFLWLALGPRLGATQLLAGVPIWGSFRYAEKLVAPLTLCLALAAGLGVDAAREVRWLPRAAGAVAGGAAAIVLACAATPLPIVALLAAAGAGTASELARAHLLEGMLHAAGAAGALAVLSRRGGRLGDRLPLALAALVLVEAAAAAPYAIHVGQTRALQTCPPPLHAAAPGPRVYSVLVRNVYVETDGLDPVDALIAKLGGYGFPSLNVRCGIDSLEPNTSVETLRAYYTLLAIDRRVLLAGRYGATHVASEGGGNPEETARLRRAVQGGRLVDLTAERGIWEIPHREWASFAPAVMPVPTFADAEQIVRYVVERGEPAVVVEGHAPFATAPGRILSVERGIEDLSIEAEADGEALLVVNDAYDPGWVAAIDSVRVPILPADALVRAVRFPAGRHRVTMRYEPPAVGQGLLLSAGGLAALVVAGAWARRRRPHAPPPVA